MRCCNVAKIVHTENCMLCKVNVRGGLACLCRVWTKVIAVRILLTLTSTEAVGVGAGQAASAASYTVPINVAIRSRLPSKVARF